ncbi:MAG: hypothetical protein CBD97_01970 [Pelagibacteraceae bacterium TMED237]|nr:MAG: hypothetical protein CBD97_01970 [Pelagibacteraceae bacterium TMED237]
MTIWNTGLICGLITIFFLFITVIIIICMQTETFKNKYSYYKSLRKAKLQNKLNLIGDSKYTGHSYIESRRRKI